MKVVVLLMTTLLTADDPAGAEPSPEQLRFFETSVRPLLVEHCFKCHGEKKQWGSLRLDSREGVLKGGDSGAAIDANSPKQSLLLERLRESDKDLRMPKGGQLTKRQIETLTRWVEMGASFPAHLKSKRTPRYPNHWSFQPLGEVTVPEVRNADWSQSEIDNFILARLEQVRLSPAATAERRRTRRPATQECLNAQRCGTPFPIPCAAGSVPRSPTSKTERCLKSF